MTSSDGTYQQAATQHDDDDYVDAQSMASSQACPEDHVNCCSRLFYSWVNPMLTAGYKRLLMPNDIWQLPRTQQASYYASTINRGWEMNRRKSHAMIRTMFWFIRQEWYWPMLLVYFIRTVCVFGAPFLVRELLQFIQENPRNYPEWVGVALAVAIAGNAAVMSMGFHTYYWIGLKCALAVRGAVITLVFQKSLRMNLAERRAYSPGDIVNLVSVDADNIMNFCWSGIHDFWIAPISLFAVLALLIYLLGWDALLGVGILLFNMLVAAGFSRIMAKLQLRGMMASDERMRMTNELLASIKLIKLYAWEDWFIEKITRVRNFQHFYVKWRNLLGSVNRFFAASSPLLVALGTFGIYVMQGHSFDPTVAFTSLMLFNMLRDPLNRTIDSMDMMVKTLLGLRRIEAFMRIANVEHYVKYIEHGQTISPTANSNTNSNGNEHTNTYTAGEIGVQIINGTFEWDALEDEAAQDAADAELERRAARLAASDGSRPITGVHYRDQSATHGDHSNGDMTMNNKQRGSSSRASGGISSSPSIDGARTTLLIKDNVNNKDSKTNGNSNGNGNGGGYGTITSAVPRRARRNSNNVLNQFGASPKGSPQISRSNSSTSIASLGVPPPAATGPLRNTLEDISINFPAGRLTIIVGAVGSGKSSLIHALLAEMHCIRGSVSVPRHITFCPQSAWMLNDTIRGNVCFGLPYDADKFNRAIKYCCMEPDLAMFDHKDMTEIGENGLNLSGGQKQRLGLARAVYADADAVLMDDCLSAVDAHVGKSLFDHCISGHGILAGKTRILVTHQLQFVSGADWVVVMDRGRVQHQGTYQQLIERGLEFEAIVENAKAMLSDEKEKSKSPTSPKKTAATPATTTTVSSDESKQIVPLPLTPPTIVVPTVITIASPPSATPVTSTMSLPATNKPSSSTHFVATTASQPLLRQHKGGDLTQAERMAIGKVSSEVYRHYLASGGGVPVFIILTIVVLVSQTATVASDLFLANWSSAAASEARRNMSLPFDTEHIDFFAWRVEGTYVQWYAILVSIACGMLLARGAAVSLATAAASRRLFYDMFSGLMRAPQSFFDSTPSGRIINRSSKDQDIADTSLPLIVQDIFNCVFTVLGTIATVCYIQPLAAPPIVVISIGFGFVQLYYLRTSRQLKRNEAITRSPIYSHFTESITGITSVRAHKQGERFEKICKLLLDNNVSYFFYGFAVNRWLGVRLELIGSCVICLSSVLAVVLRDTLTAGLVGLAVTSALALSGNLNWMVRQFSELEVQMNAVERIREYGRTPSEAPLVIAHHRPPNNWPTRGHIVIRDLVLQYRPDLPPILRGLTATIAPGEKIGIVGRTGAGKSTLTLALLRLVEPTSGSIWIDDIDITTIGLKDLRSKISIIPQDPVLFQGTIRSNLDPFDQCRDDELWTALGKIHMRETLEAMPDGLYTDVENGGENFSVGERQLLCLARAMARKSKIVIMDEASASLDFKTDMLIREFVAKEFASCTVLTIAHRLNTVMDSTRVMVLSRGAVVEFDTVRSLLSKPNGVFASLVRDANHAMDQRHDQLT